MEEIVRVENGKIEISNDVISSMKNFEKMRIHMEIVEKKLRESLLNAMKSNNITNWQTEDGSIKAVYKAPTTRKNIDSARLKAEMPEIAEEYSKIVNVKDSVMLTIDV